MNSKFMQEPDEVSLGKISSHELVNSCSSTIIYSQVPSKILMEGDCDGIVSEDILRFHTKDETSIIVDHNALSDGLPCNYVALHTGLDAVPDTILGSNTSILTCDDDIACMKNATIIIGQNNENEIILTSYKDDDMLLDVDGNIGAQTDLKDDSIVIPLDSSDVFGHKFDADEITFQNPVGSERTRLDSSQSDLQCPTCNASSFQDEGSLKNHVCTCNTKGAKRRKNYAKDSPNLIYSCSVCSFSTGKANKITKHFKKHFKDGDCGSIEALAQEVEIEEANKVHSCPACSYTTSHRNKMDKHVKKHVNEGYHPSGKKRNHPEQPPQRQHHNAEEYHCNLCAYACTVEKALAKHKKSHENSNDFAVEVSCKICGKDRKNDKELKRHMKKHIDGGKFICDVCDFSSEQLKKIIQHRRMHTGERPHLCPFCSYRSARRDNLRSHVRRMHKKENMYIDTFDPMSGNTTSD